VPTPVERTLVRAPGTRVGPVSAEERRVLTDTDAVGAKYDTAMDRESAAELLAARAEAVPPKPGKREAPTPWDRATRGATAALGRQAASELSRAVLGRGTAGRLGGALLRGILGGLLR
jgi:uncharacterized protein